MCWPAIAESGFEPERIWSALARCRARGAGAGRCRGRHRAARPGRQGRRAAGLAAAGRRGAHPVKCNATLPAANPAPLRALAERWAAAGFDTFKLKVGLAGDVAQVATVREAAGREARLRVDANGAWSVDGGDRATRRMAQHTLELAEQPVAGLEQMAEVRRGEPGLASPPTRASSRPATRAEPSSSGLRARDAKLAKVGGIAATIEIAAEIPTYLSSALEGPVGIAAAAHAAQALPQRGTPASPPTGSRPSASSPSRSPRECERATDMLLLSDEPGLGVEMDDAALAAPALSRSRHSMRYRYLTARWTRPTATRRSPRPWSRSSRAAACAAPSSPPARARRPWRWRCGASPRSRSRSSLDERSAGFFALGAALGERGARGRRSAPRARPPRTSTPPWSRPTRPSVPLIVLTADRPPELRGIGAGQTIDQLKLYGDAVRWFCEVGTHEADDDGLLHFRSVACRAYAAARRRPPPGPGPPERPLARAAGADPGRGRRDRHRSAGAGGARRAAADRGRRRAPRARTRRCWTSSPSAIAAAPRGPDRRRPPARSRRWPSRSRRWPTPPGYPVLAEPTSQLRWGPHDRALVVSAYDLIARDARPQRSRPSWSSASATCRPARRCGSGSRRSGGCARSSSTRRATGRSRRRRAETSCAPTPPRWPPASASGSRPARPAPERLDGERGSAPTARSRGGRRRELGASSGEAERARRLAGAGRGAARRRSGLAASSMPVRDQEAFLPPGRASVRFLANRGANGIDGLISTAAGAAAERRPDLGGARRPRARPRPRRPRPRRATPELRLLVLDNGGGGIFHFLPQAEAVAEPRSSRRCWGPRRGSTSAAPPSCSGWTSRWPETRTRSSRPWRETRAS